MPRVHIDPDKLYKKPPPQGNAEYTYRPKGEGRPAFEAQEWQRVAVHKLATVGVPQATIATLIEISDVTLVRYFGPELQAGRAEGQAWVCGKLFEHIKKDNFAALQFYMRTQMGWVEPKSEPEEVEERDVSKLTDEEIQQELEALRSRARVTINARGLEAPVPP